MSQRGQKDGRFDGLMRHLGQRSGSAALRKRLGRLACRLSAGASALPVLIFAAAPAAAQVEPFSGLSFFEDGTLAPADVVSAAVVFGILGAAFLSAFWVIALRRRTEEQNVALRQRNGELSAALQRTESLLNLRDQCLVVWPKEGASRPEVIGSLPAGSGAPEDGKAFLAFGRWLGARAATELDQAIIRLRDQNETFETIVASRNGTLLEVTGRRTVHHTIVRFGSVSASRRELVESRAQLQATQMRLALYDALAERLSHPIWQRMADGALIFVNPAFARSVEGGSAAAVLNSQTELLESDSRARIDRERDEEGFFTGRLSSILGGERHRLAISEIDTGQGSCGLAIDRTETETLSAEIERLIQNHADMLDHLSTAIAIFDENQTLRFYNQAFQSLWGLDSAFLENQPDNTILLDRLRGEGLLPEQPEWRRWKNNLFAAYRSLESAEHWWHLPDGRTVRVITNPQPRGGVTWIFENLTEQIKLESRYKTAVRVQGETIDNLAEGVVVFGPDGRIRLTNPAFVSLWNLAPELTAENVHISAIAAALRNECVDSPWDRFVALVTGIEESREEVQGTVELKDGLFLGYSASPLPNGQIMLTFIDQTDSTRVSRALQEKNDALKKADDLKNDFVQNVSYQLRSPLTNIIGFTEALSGQMAGPLTETQRDYLNHITSSSEMLLTLVNDILDLATVDAGVMRLNMAEVNMAQVVADALRPLGERLRDDQLTLSIDLDHAPETMTADPERLRQIVFNLVSGAADHAPEGSEIGFSCRSRSDHVEIAVRTDGQWAERDAVASIFERFSFKNPFPRPRESGLGLSIVKSFVELHGGSVAIDMLDDGATIVLCRFPKERLVQRDRSGA